ncbi:MAG: hypothetical protein HC878_00110 [Leptolyngbyaceae cyanobacterium SL_5_14]|nr:hypothetical protein [Leptolyngbyaceae cyanobacterium SL_5_14]
MVTPNQTNASRPVFAYPSASAISAQPPRTHQAYNAPLMTNEEAAMEQERINQQKNHWKTAKAKSELISEFYGSATAFMKSKIARQSHNQSVVQHKIAEQSTVQTEYQFVTAAANTETTKQQAIQASDRAVSAQHETQINRVNILTNLRNLKLEAGSSAVQYDHASDLAGLQKRLRDVVTIPQSLPAVDRPRLTIH